jgi:GrpB-like predicted nucleotidyltransferase (UPF0157 family)
MAEPMTEEQLRAVTVGGEPTQLNGPVHLAEYDPAWPELFAREEAKIRGALGDLVVEIHHVGSTSVPGLAAKPIIDICLVVPDTTDEPAYVPALEAVDYVLRAREPAWFEHRLFKGHDPSVNLHVYPAGCLEIERYLLFRDRLRTHPEELDAYLAAKRELAARTWTYVQHYADAKSEVVEAIIGRARAEREGVTPTA